MKVCVFFSNKFFSLVFPKKNDCLLLIFLQCSVLIVSLLLRSSTSRQCPVVGVFFFCAA